MASNVTGQPFGEVLSEIEQTATLKCIPLLDRLHALYWEEVDKVAALGERAEKAESAMTDYARRWSADRNLREALTAAREGLREALAVSLTKPGVIGENVRAVLEKALAASEVKDVCDHEWLDARNEVVTSGEFCRKCNAVRPGNAE